jgi:hypothetical protein
MDARGFAHLGCPVRLDPALRGDADASHASQMRHQLGVDRAEEPDDGVVEGGKVPLERAAAGRLESYRQRTPNADMYSEAVGAPLIDSGPRRSVDGSLTASRYKAGGAWLPGHQPES